jgi:hypothetical protein
LKKNEFDKDEPGPPRRAHEVARREKRVSAEQEGSIASPGSSPVAIYLPILGHRRSRRPPPVRHLPPVSRQISASFPRGDAMDFARGEKFLGGGGWARERGERRE